jgi:hypothetical protein
MMSICNLSVIGFAPIKINSATADLITSLLVELFLDKTSESHSSPFTSVITNYSPLLCWGTRYLIDQIL